MHYHHRTDGGRRLPRHEEIAEAAYFLWESQGRPGGRDVEFWLHAEWRLRWRAHRQPVYGIFT
jgi:hypothetical protein